MQNFTFQNSTEILFGKGQLNKLGEILARYGRRVLLVYGGGSIKKTGLYDRVMTQLAENGLDCWELSGVDPNPRISSVREGARLCREHDIQAVLAVGGGSSIDCAKVVAAAVSYEGDPWDLVLDRRKVTSVLPVVTVLTLAATGSEMNSGAVISNPDTNQKLGAGHPGMLPKASILDPELTFTVPPIHTAAGVVDIMSHVTEAYFAPTDGQYVQDRFAESLLKTCVHYGPLALKNPCDYEARANLMWASSMALCGLISCGKSSVYPVHKMEHELSAFYDITHGVGLAILTPCWMTYVLDACGMAEKFALYGANVLGLSATGDIRGDALRAIDATASFFASLGVPMRLTEVGIGQERLAEMARAACRSGVMAKGHPPLMSADVEAIFRNAL